MQKVEVGVVREGVPVGEIDAALRRDDADAQALVLVDVLRPDGGRDRARQDRAPAEARIARVGVENAALDRALGSPPQKAATARGALSSAIATLARSL